MLDAPQHIRNSLDPTSHLFPANIIEQHGTTLSLETNISSPPQHPGGALCAISCETLKLHPAYPDSHIPPLHPSRKVSRRSSDSKAILKHTGPKSQQAAVLVDPSQEAKALFHSTGIVRAFPASRSAPYQAIRPPETDTTTPLYLHAGAIRPTQRSSAYVDKNSAVYYISVVPNALHSKKDKDVISLFFSFLNKTNCTHLLGISAMDLCGMAPCCLSSPVSQHSSQPTTSSAMSFSLPRYPYS